MTPDALLSSTVEQSPIACCTLSPRPDLVRGGRGLRVAGDAEYCNIVCTRSRRYTISHIRCNAELSASRSCSHSSSVSEKAASQARPVYSVRYPGPDVQAWYLRFSCGSSSSMRNATQTSMNERGNRSLASIATGPALDSQCILTTP